MLDMTEKDGKLMCAFSGELDSVSCSDFQGSLMEQIEKSGLPVVLDLESVDFVSSSFLGIVIRVAKKVGRDNLAIINAREKIREVFAISGMDEQLNIS